LIDSIDYSWTLFLDRDGVINEEKSCDYILHWDDFNFLPYVLDSINIFNKLFHKIIIVTNQRCIGLNLITEEKLCEIHNNMTDIIIKHGGRIDKLYYASAIDQTHYMRKPNTGMAMMAKQDFPSIDFSKSIIVGNTQTDIIFGAALGMYTIFINGKSLDDKVQSLVNEYHDSLWSFAQTLLIK